MSYGPREQNPDHHTLHLLARENSHIRLRPQHVDFDLLEILAFKL